ncbi:rho GTPase-activating protein 19-like isoform X2 [Acanthaster planci]|uniref:Rho GTPase-activating protein 19-like isoform X2 n=1 Tax=Acanthaster planci TaxID=133434 RepID=A0A8B7XXH0_ACAPL|nr:rho GTPase-activating protein 19-like isoform X2 [Acanthaster planci]
MSSEYLCNPLYYVEAMRHKHPQLLNDWCCTELSHVLDFSGSDGLGQVLAGVVDLRHGKTFVKKFTKNKQRANSQSGVFGAPLSEDGYRQARQLIDFLKDFITKEGIFRVPGNSERQRRLKDKISSGLLVDLENDVFTAHDVACVLKTFLGDLPEPLLTDKHYPAHVQAAGLTYEMDKVPSLTEELGRRYQAQRIHEHITALRYLFLMLPPVNFKMLREILELLHCITKQEKLNKMSAFNLGVMFAPHILWPRYLTTEDLRNQVLVNKLNCGAEFMITQCHKIFKVPAKMLKRCEQYVKNGKLEDDEEPKPKERKAKVKKEQTQTEAALAHLYASVQDMPPSAKKRKLMKQFAKNCNMPGTPTQVKEDILLRSQERHCRQRKHVRSRSAGDAICKRVEASADVKRRRPAPNPPVEHEKTIQQRMNLRNVRHELLDQLQKSYAKSCTPPSTPETTTTTSARGSYARSDLSPAKTHKKRRAPPTPKQQEEQQLATATKLSQVIKPVLRERPSSQLLKQQSDRPACRTPESGGLPMMKPVPKPRKLKEDGQVACVYHGHSHPQPRNGQKHELNSLV